MPRQIADPGFEYRRLHAALVEISRQIALQARSRPRQKVPPQTLAIVKEHLAALRRFRVGLGAKSRSFPAIPGGPMRFSTLALLLGLTRHEFEIFGKAFQLDDPAPAPPAHSGFDEDAIAQGVLDLLIDGGSALRR